MITLSRIAVGEPYPLPHPQNDGMTPALDGASLTFVTVLRGVTGKEARAFRRGRLDYGVYVERHIPEEGGILTGSEGGVAKSCAKRVQNGHFQRTSATAEKSNISKLALGGPPFERRFGRRRRISR
jgi:hypothetical protein